MNPITTEKQRSAARRKILIDHLDGKPVPIIHGSDVRKDMRHVMVREKLLCYWGSHARPSHTVITQDGRMLLCQWLGEMADALTDAIKIDPRITDRIKDSVTRLLDTIAHQEQERAINERAAEHSASCLR